MSISRRRLLKTTALTAGFGAIASKFTGVLGASDDAVAKLKLGPTYSNDVEPAASTRERLLADFGWKFALGHANDPAKDFGWGRSTAFAKSGSLIGGRNSVTSTGFDDRAWTAVDLPHDWAIDLPFSDNRELNEHGAKPLGRTYPETSIGWYRRTFNIPASDNGRRISIEFDGIFRDAMVILNGHYLGRNLSGYTPFRCDITDFVTYGGPNVLVVRVDATEYEGWFYEGAGIYRHVWLEKTSPLHIAHNGVFVTTTTNAGGSATVTIRTDVVNESDSDASAALMCEISDPTGKPVGRTGLNSGIVTLKPWARRTLTQTVTVPAAQLWSPDTPHLYRAAVQLGSHDATDITFGIRTVQWDADKGLFLNGKPLKIKGTCNHHDHAGRWNRFAGSAARVANREAQGDGLQRVSHVALSARDGTARCVRSTWHAGDGRTAHDGAAMKASGTTRTMIRRDRNHPSIILWSIGNEEHRAMVDRGERVGRTIVERAHINSTPRDT